jgi:hypothetical protein
VIVRTNGRNLDVADATVEKEDDSPASSLVFVLTVLDFVQALDGFGSAFTTCQYRKRHLPTARTIQMATEYTSNS